MQKFLFNVQLEAQLLTILQTWKYLILQANQCLFSKVDKNKPQINKTF